MPASPGSYLRWISLDLFRPRLSLESSQKCRLEATSRQTVALISPFIFALAQAHLTAYNTSEILLRWRLSRRRTTERSSRKEIVQKRFLDIFKRLEQQQGESGRERESRPVPRLHTSLMPLSRPKLSFQFDLWRPSGDSSEEAPLTRKRGPAGDDTSARSLGPRRDPSGSEPDCASGDVAMQERSLPLQCHQRMERIVILIRRSRERSAYYSAAPREITSSPTAS